MSFGHREGGDLKYAQIVAGKFAIKATEEEAKDASGKLNSNHRSRVNKNNETVFEFVFDSADGKIERLELKEGKFGPQVSFSLRFDDGTLVVISFNAFNEDGSTLTMIASSFGDQIGLIDFSKPVEVGLYKKDGKVRGIAFRQGGVYIPNAKDNASFAEHVKSRPQAKERTTFTGEKKWDYSAPSEWQFTQIKAAVERLVAEGVGNNSAPLDAPDLDREPPF